MASGAAPEDAGAARPGGTHAAGSGGGGKAAGGGAGRLCGGEVSSGRGRGGGHSRLSAGSRDGAALPAGAGLPRAQPVGAVDPGQLSERGGAGEQAEGGQQLCAGVGAGRLSRLRGGAARFRRAADGGRAGQRTRELLPPPGVRLPDGGSKSGGRTLLGRHVRDRFSAEPAGCCAGGSGLHGQFGRGHDRAVAVGDRGADYGCGAGLLSLLVP